jgi:hypothetical protein
MNCENCEIMKIDVLGILIEIMFWLVVTITSKGMSGPWIGYRSTLTFNIEVEVYRTAGV